MTTSSLNPRSTDATFSLLVDLLAKLPVHMGLMLISIAMWLSLVMAVGSLVS